MFAKVLIATIGVVVGFFVGRANIDGPIDNTGRDSIVIEFEETGWCELRGPARFEVFDAFAEVYK